MPRTAVVRTMLATAIGLGTIFAATPAAQAAAPCCQVSLNGVPGQLSSGGPAGGFTATFVNGSDRQITTLQLAFTFSGGGDQLRSGNIDFEKLNGSGTWQRLNVGRHNGSLGVTDNRFRLNQPLAPGSQTTFQYRLAFVNNAPSVNVGMSLVVSGRLGGGFGGGRGDNQQLAATGPVQIAVLGAAPPPTPTPTPKPTHSATPTPTATDTSQALPTDSASVAPVQTDNALPTSGTGGGTSGFMWLAYTIGALLLLAGIGVIGTMLWKRGPQIVEAEEPDDDPYQSPAYGGTTYAATRTYGPGGVPYDEYGDEGPQGGGGRHSAPPTRQMPPPQAPTRHMPPADQMPPTQHMPRI